MPDAGRVHYLDWLKAVIVYGIFFFHVSLIFSIQPWLVWNRQHSLLLSAFAGLTFPWGIPAMFLISGADAWFGIRSGAALEYVRKRVLRLLVPFVPAMLVLTPLQRWVSSSSPPPAAVTLPAAYAAYLRHPAWDPLHLWFLPYLFAISIVLLPALLWLRGATGRRLVDRLVTLASRRGGLLLLAVPLAVAQICLRPRFPDYQSWADVATYLYVFLVGAVLFGDRRFEAAIRRDIRVVLGTAAIGVAATGLLLLAAPGHVPVGPRVAPLAEAAYCAAWSLDITGCLLALLYLGIRWLDFPNRAMSYASESILPFYVLHHPILLVVAAYVVPLDLGLWTKVGLIVGTALPATLLVYEFGIRRWRATRFLFGLKPLPPRLTEPLRGAVAAS